jgi:hypothetical protein
MRPFLFPLSPASEFPNDNPELHLGAIWTLPDTHGVLEVEPHASTPASHESIPCPTTSEVRLIVAEVVPPAEDRSPENDTPVKEPGSPENDTPAKEPPTAPAKTPPIEEPPAKKPGVEEPPAKTPPVEDPEVVTPRMAADESKPNVEGFAVLVRAMSLVATAAGVAVAEACFFDLLVVGKTPLASLPEATVAGLVEAGYASVSESTLFISDAALATAGAWRAILRDEAVDFAVCGSRMLDEWAADFVARVVGTPQKTEILRRELRRHGVAAFGLLENAA